MARFDADVRGPGAIKRSAVLAPVKDALRAPLRGGPRPSLTAAARGAPTLCRPGRRNGPQPNRETTTKFCRSAAAGTPGLTVHVNSEHIFALCSLLGFQFAPRIPDLKHRRLYSFGKLSDYPTLAPLIGGRINVALIRAYWTDILRIIASLRAGTVTASVTMRQLASHPRQNGIAAALRELGRMERTLFTLDWIEDPELRRSAGHELNKGETRNSLARAVFIHRLGEIRDRTSSTGRLALTWS